MFKFRRPKPVTVQDIVGSQPDLTGGLDSVAYQRKMRGYEDETPQERQVRLAASDITKVTGQDFVDREAAIRDCLPRDGSPMTDEQKAVFNAYVYGGPSSRYDHLTYDPFTFKSRIFTSAGYRPRYMPDGTRNPQGR